MGRIMSFDYGYKRTGIAISDPLKIISSPYKTCESSKVINFIKNYLEEDKIDQEVQALAEKLRDGAKYSIRWTKTSINAGLKVMANSIIDRAAAFENVTQLMEDHKIALEAFAKKETPKFKQK